VLSADIKNCRLVLIPPRGHAILRQFGTTGYCLHHPPASYGSPNGAFPTVDGHVLVTEINGSWVDEITSAGRLLWSVHLPGVAYPSDSNQIGPDRYLTVDWSSPGQVVIFDRAGHILWRYARGLNHPSLALPLPNGDILLNDDFDHRVIVIDPHTDRVVWQYGHDGVAGQAPGYLDNPDGVDLLPPYSFLIRTFG
jgi:outer membrane protein assembly factor BamB